MSRIGKLPVFLLQGVDIIIEGQKVTVKGPKGSLKREFHPLVEIFREDNIVRIVPRDASQKSRALWGLSRSILNNMVIGVSNGFTNIMEIIGVGYRAEIIDNILKMSLGFSHPVIISLPEGISCIIEKNTILRLSSIDKELLGQTCAQIRAWRPPEPYKGKGIKFVGEVIQRKVGKTGSK